MARAISSHAPWAYGAPWHTRGKMTRVGWPCNELPPSHRRARVRHGYLEDRPAQARQRGRPIRIDRPMCAARAGHSASSALASAARRDLKPADGVTRGASYGLSRAVPDDRRARSALQVCVRYAASHRVRGTGSSCQSASALRWHFAGLSGVPRPQRTGRQKAAKSRWRLRAMQAAFHSPYGIRFPPRWASTSQTLLCRPDSPACGVHLGCGKCPFAGQGRSEATC